jgi:hypothetical protein
MAVGVAEAAVGTVAEAIAAETEATAGIVGSKTFLSR